MLLVFAAWTSAISIIEPAVAFLVENMGLTRVMATAMIAIGAWFLGIGALLSLNVWSDYTLFDMGILDLLDYVTANILLPLGGFLIAIFVGWRMTSARCSPSCASSTRSCTRSGTFWCVSSRRSRSCLCSCAPWS